MVMGLTSPRACYQIPHKLQILPRWEQWRGILQVCKLNVAINGCVHAFMHVSACKRVCYSHWEWHSSPSPSPPPLSNQSASLVKSAVITVPAGPSHSLSSTKARPNSLHSQAGHLTGAHRDSLRLWRVRALPHPTSPTPVLSSSFPLPARPTWT